MTSSFLIWGCVSKGCFERYYISKGIEDFNLDEHGIHQCSLKKQVWLIPDHATWQILVQAGQLVKLNALLAVSEGQKLEDREETKWITGSKRAPFPPNQKGKGL